MLNIGKLAAGAEEYYLASVASGVEDYYLGSGEAPGYWLDDTPAGLGLTGRVAAEQLRAVLAGRHPASGDPLISGQGRGGRRVPGFDCTFRAPKSVSLLYGLADAETSKTVRDAHDTAVAAAMRYLEAHAGYSRRGPGGAEGVKVDGLLTAAFRHRSSRAGDPLLHTHVLVANLGRAVDDRRWRTLDARRLYTHAKTAGYLYQAQLRHELTRRLDVEWGPVRNGAADLAGVPDEVIAAFSQRRTEIVARMESRGESSARAAQTATLATRKAKDYAVEPEALGATWLARAAALGFGPEQVAALLQRTVHAALKPDAAARTAEELAGPAGLTANASTFTRRDVLQAWCDRLPTGADTHQVEALADALLDPRAGAAIRLLAPAGQQLTSADVIRRSDGRIVAATGDEPRYSTPELLAIEQWVIDGCLARRNAGVAQVPRQVVEDALARRPTIGDEQAAMVRRLTTSGAGVEVVVGKAGAGKTYALDAARDAWQRAGVRVVGAALAARAAAELHAGAGIASFTIDALLTELDRPRPAGEAGLAAGSVLVVDEAGMVGTRKLARLLDHAEQARAKVVLVGDHHQLPEIDAGGVFRGLCHRLPAVELTDNRRQTAAWERDALDELRTGSSTEAIAAYTGAGRVVTGDTAEAVREQLVGDWWAARAEHGADAGVMIAARVTDVDDLNERARAHLAAHGQLTGPELRADPGKGFRAGDRVVTLHNDRRLGVVNGTRGVVASVDPDARTLRMRLDEDDRTVTLPAVYLDAGHVTHGYAITGHKAQGLTTDRAWVLGSDTVYREWGYVALSRGRHDNRLYVVAGDDGPDEAHTHGATATADGVDQFVRGLERSRAQSLALDHGSADAGLNGDQGNDGSGDTAPSCLHRRLTWAHEERTEAARQLHEAQQRHAQALVEASAASGPIKRLVGRRQLSEARGQLRLHGQAVQLWQERLEELDARISDLEQRCHGAAVDAAGDCGRSAEVIPRHTSRRFDRPLIAAAPPRRDPERSNARDVAELELA